MPTYSITGLGCYQIIALQHLVAAQFVVGFSMSVIPETPAERRARLLEERGSTFHQHGVTAADDESGGRFAARGKPTVVGTTEIPKYPQLPEGSPWSGAQPGPGDEPPLGFDNPALASPTGCLLLPVATGPASADAPSFSLEDDVQRTDAGPSSSSPNGGDSLHLAGGNVETAAVTDSGLPPPSSSEESNNG
jgi:hypothetical protein